MPGRLLSSFYNFIWNTYLVKSSISKTVLKIKNFYPSKILTDLASFNILIHVNRIYGKFRVIKIMVEILKDCENQNFWSPGLLKN